MDKISNFVVKRRKYIILIVLVISAFCVLLMTKVNVNYDLGSYLPKETDTHAGVQIMERDFGLIGNMQIMINDIDHDTSINIYNMLASIEGVKSIDFDNTNDKYYKDNKALYLLTLNNDNFSKEAKETLKNIKEKLKVYDYYINGGVANAETLNTTLKSEIPYFLVIAVVLIAVVLLLVSTSWLEPLIFLLISGISIVINYGSNIVFENVSFVTFAIAALLQLALSMDYSIMLMDKYHHELKKSGSEESMGKALKKAFSTISSSSLTTIFGLLSMVFMSFLIGRDLGLVLAKGILINVLVVFLVLPGVILELDKILKKTSKKQISIPTRFFAFLGIKGRYIITTMMLILLVSSYFVQSNLKLDYSYKFNDDNNRIISETFGKYNQMLFLYENKQDSKEVIEFLSNYKFNGKPILGDVIDYQSTIGRKLSKEEFAGLSGLDINIVSVIYGNYMKQYNYNEEKLSVIDIITFISDHIIFEPKFQSYFNEEMIRTLNIQKKELEEYKKLLTSLNYNRMIIRLNLDIESDETEQFYEDFRKITKDIYDESYILGETALAYDIKSTFNNEQLFITILTIIAMTIIIGLSFKSIAIPLILVSLIQGAIWISLSLPVIMNKSLFFMALIIAQCIQMGATIDYAILLSSNYLNYRHKQNKKESLINSLKASILTIFTSASILIIAAFTIAFVSSQELIQTICLVIGRGTIISTVVVLIILPAYLIIFDKFIERTTYKTKFNKD